VNFTFNPSNRKPVGGSSLNMIDDDSNEADHSDLDHSEIEIESYPIETKSNLQTSTVDNEENEDDESADLSCNIVPRPPTPPKARSDDSTDDLEQESPSIKEIQINEQNTNENVQTFPQESTETEDFRETLSIPSTTKTKPHKQKDSKHVQFSDVEDEIP